MHIEKEMIAYIQNYYMGGIFYKLESNCESCASTHAHTAAFLSFLANARMPVPYVYDEPHFAIKKGTFILKKRNKEKKVKTGL